MDFQESKRSN